MAQGQRRRWLRRVLIAGATLLIVAFLAEMGSAATAEHRLSDAVRAAGGFDHDPEVNIGGFPYLTSGGRHDKVSIVVPAQVRDRSARLEADLFDAQLPAAVWPTFAADTAITARRVESRVRLDQKTVGRAMGIVDLTVHAPAPKRPGAGSPADGWVKTSTGIVLTGTVPVPVAADAERTVLVSVTADFTHVGQAIAIRATGVYTGPEDHAEAALQPGDEAVILAAFTRTLPTMALPFGIAATGARAENADVVLFGTADAVTVTPGAFYRPLA